MMRSPAFPPRRPSHLIRYIFPALIILCFIYYLSSDLNRTPVPKTPVAPAHVEPILDPLDDESLIRHPPTPPPPSSEQPIVEPDLREEKLQETAKGSEKPFDGLADTNGGLELAESDKVKSGDNKGDTQPAQVVEVIDEDEKDDSTRATPTKKPTPIATGDHPIDKLIRKAEKEFESLLAKESTTLAEAAEAYRNRRGRHPPPGFDTWFYFAQENDAIIVEDFFDRIYHDLNPFWGLDPKVIRKEAWDFEMTINIRNQNASAQSDWFWTQIWLKMFKTIEHLLPDMDIALNAMDEPRLVVPWEELNTYMKKAERTRKMAPVSEVVSKFQKLPDPEKSDKYPPTRDKHWEGTKPFWLIARRGCPPDSLARRTRIVDTYNEPVFSPEYALPHQYEGYVSNFSLSTEFCHQPDLQGLEGIFIHPLSTSSSRVLFPLFGGSKLATNNEILLPAPMYWNEEERFTGGDDHGPAWEDKYGPLIWRGVATGGRNQESTWQGFQRHRFVAMNNGTQIAMAELEIERPLNFELPAESYGVTASKEKRLGEWVFEWADVGFTDLMCDPDYTPQGEDGTCPYTDPHFELLLGQPLSEQFTYKYLPDIDGNSFSGRYLGFLRSTGLPIKSTLWHEWHDSRLVAWKHFAPMDNRFGDYYGIMEYFLGYGDITPGHDEEAKKIAMDGKEWAEKVLRKEDMQIYVLRLLLEYARLCDDNREKLGWVGDLR
ncbi:glycosyltransferase family 90 protein [Poronia punctata]|nr:glycosyltransferase family 90 protein [Poronia punctata]